MAQAKRKNTTKPSRPPAPLTGAEIYKQALPRMEYILATLATYVVADGWHESWESGPMPKRAADVMTYFRARAAGARENAAQEAKVNAFIADCGQSLDWVFGGDVRGMICIAAGHSPQSASLTKASGACEKARGVSSGLGDLESSLRDLPRIARLADEQLHRAVGELEFNGSEYTEIPNYAKTELAIFAVSQVAQMAKDLESLYDRIYGEIREAHAA
jgi:hypothetical protein